MYIAVVHGALRGEERPERQAPEGPRVASTPSDGQFTVFFTHCNWVEAGPPGRKGPEAEHPLPSGGCLRWADGPRPKPESRRVPPDRGGVLLRPLRRGGVRPQCEEWREDGRRLPAGHPEGAGVLGYSEWLEAGRLGAEQGAWALGGVGGASLPVGGAQTRPPLKGPVR
jgi:hypothetical protein